METFIKVYFELEEGENLRLGLLAAGCWLWRVWGGVMLKQAE